MARRPIERLRGLPLFVPDDYLALNPDVAAAGIDPAEHALQHGLAEARPLFRRESLARAWSEAIPGPAAVGADGSGAEAPLPPVSVLVSTASDPADAALAADLVEVLTSAGLVASSKDETTDPDADHGLPIVVAPHRFFGSGLGALWARRDAVERSLTFNTAPIHSSSFKRALPWILRSRGLLEASPQVVGILAASTLPAFLMRFPLPPRRRWLDGRDVAHPLVQALPPAARGADFDPRAWDSRPIDVAFFGANSGRRSAFFRRQASAFASRPCFFYTAQRGVDRLDDDVERRSHFRLAGHLSGQARITLHLAEDEFPHFDWHRCVAQTMASGSVVVTDSDVHRPDHEVGRHVFQDDVRHLAELTRWLLDEADGRRAAEEARNAAFALLDHGFDGFAAGLRSFLSAIATPSPV